MFVEKKSKILISRVNFPWFHFYSEYLDGLDYRNKRNKSIYLEQQKKLIVLPKRFFFLLFFSDYFENKKKKIRSILLNMVEILNNFSKEQLAYNCYLLSKSTYLQKFKDSLHPSRKSYNHLMVVNSFPIKGYLTPNKKKTFLLNFYFSKKENCFQIKNRNLIQYLNLKGPVLNLLENPLIMFIFFFSKFLKNNIEFLFGHFSPSKTWFQDIIFWNIIFYPKIFHKTTIISFFLDLFNRIILEFFRFSINGLFHTIKNHGVHSLNGKNGISSSLTNERKIYWKNLKTHLMKNYFLLEFCAGKKNKEYKKFSRYNPKNFLFYQVLRTSSRCFFIKTYPEIYTLIFLIRNLKLNYLHLIQGDIKGEIFKILISEFFEKMLSLVIYKIQINRLFLTKYIEEILIKGKKGLSDNICNNFLNKKLGKIDKNFARENRMNAIFKYCFVEISLFSTYLRDYNTFIQKITHSIGCFDDFLPKKTSPTSYNSKKTYFVSLFQLAEQLNFLKIKKFLTLPIPVLFPYNSSEKKISLFSISKSRLIL